MASLAPQLILEYVSHVSCQQRRRKCDRVKPTFVSTTSRETRKEISMNKATLLIICCALLVIPSLAQNLQTPKTCSLAGTWYGGSDYKYISTITPITGQTFAITSDPVFDNASFGYKAWTRVSGELVKI